jgi:hypothetical protein
MATNVKILLRRGTRSEITADTLDAGELGYTTDTNQLYVGTADSSDEIVFDPFANAHAVIQTYLDSYTTEAGLEIDEDLVIKNISDVSALLTDMETNGGFNVEIFGRARTNVEVLTEKSFSQVYANMHLESHAAATGLRSDLFKKELASTTGTFLKYAKTVSTSFFIDYSLKQVRTVSPAITFIRVGTIIVINGAAVIPAIAQAKLTDTNTEIWQDDGDGVAQADEFSNIEFTADLVVTAGKFAIGTEYTIVTPGTTDFTLIGAADSIAGTVFTATGVGTGDGTASDDNLRINYAQDVDFTTEISYTVKRWTM